MIKINLKIKVSIPHVFLRPNGGGGTTTQGRFARSAAKKRAREECKFLAGLFMDVHNKREEAKASTHWAIVCYYKNKRMDDGNLIASMKSHLDGVCDAVGINDANLMLRSCEFIKCKGDESPHVDLMLLNDDYLESLSGYSTPLG